jgi:hypothetical protein
MIVTELDLNCDCGSRVIWIGEDENGVVAGVGKDLCLLSPPSLACRRSSFSGEFLGALVSSQLVTAHRDSRGLSISLRGTRTVALRVPSFELYDSVFVPSTGELYMLTTDSLRRLSTTNGEIGLLLGGLSEDDGHGRYERLSAGPQGVIAYRYGLSVCTSAGEAVLQSQLPYSHATFKSERSLVALHERYAIHEFDLRKGLIGETRAPPGDVSFLGVVDGTTVVVWRKDESSFVWLIRGEEVNEVSLGSSGLECFCAVEERNLLAIGTIQGQLLMLDLRSGRFSTCGTAASERIVELYWSERLELLFGGTRHGRLCAFRLSNRQLTDEAGSALDT